MEYFQNILESFGINKLCINTLIGAFHMLLHATTLQTERT